MRKTIEHLRKRPDHHKKAIAFGVSFVITLAIFSVWFSNQSLWGNSTTQVIAEAKTASPFEAFRDSVASGWSGFTSIFR